MAERLDHKRDLSFEPGQRFGARMLKENAAAADRHFMVGSVSQINDLRWHLRRQAQKIRRPGALRHDLPALPPGDGARRFVNVWTQFAAESRIDPRPVIEAAAYPADGSVLGEFCERHVDRRPAGDVEEILSRKGLSITQPFDARNYLIPHGFHGIRLCC